MPLVIYGLGDTYTYTHIYAYPQESDFKKPGAPAGTYIECNQEMKVNFY